MLQHRRGGYLTTTLATSPLTCPPLVCAPLLLPPRSVLPLSSVPYHLLSDAQQQLLGKLASKKVPDRKLYLETQLGVKERVAADASVVGFGLEVAPVLASTRARILPGPHLAYASPECLNPGTQVRVHCLVSTPVQHQRGDHTFDNMVQLSLNCCMSNSLNLLYGALPLSGALPVSSTIRLAYPAQRVEPSLSLPPCHAVGAWSCLHPCNLSKPFPFPSTSPCRHPVLQGQWNLRTFKAPGGSKITSWALVALMPAAEVVCEGPSSLDTFLKDLVTCLGTAGVEASVPPVVTQQVTGETVWSEVVCVCVVVCGRGEGQWQWQW